MTTSSSPRIACVMMQRNETELLEAWLVYHGVLVGFENLYVYDNGSTDRSVRDLLRRFQGAGVHVDDTRADAGDFEAKSHILAATIRRLHSLGGHDLYFPLDCDEFIFRWGGPRGMTCERTAILDYLSQFAGADCALNHAEQAANVPGHTDWFCLYGSNKVFFAGGDVTDLVLGHHWGSVASGREQRPLGIGYLHLHNKPFETLLRHARDKLKRRVDVTDLEAIRGYKGHGDHLAAYFSITEREYLDSFASRSSFHFPEFRTLLSAIGADSGLRRFWAPVGVITERRNPIDPHSLFNPMLYWDANPGLREIDHPALLHYWKHGREEQRPLTPAERHLSEVATAPG